MVVKLIGRIACMRRTRNAVWKKSKRKTAWEVEEQMEVQYLNKVLGNIF